MLKTSIYLLILVFLTNTVNALSFTEVNYNPPGDDNNKEYIELFSSEAINLSNFTIADLSSSDALVLLKQSASNYYLIVEEGFDYSVVEANIYSAGSAIGNNLNNGNDQITLKDENNTIIDTFSYSSDLGGNNNGKTLCKPQNTLDWTECDPSPGLQNTLEVEQTNEPETLEIIEENNTSLNNEPLAVIPKIIINEIFPNPVGDDSDPISGEWIELYNPGESLNIEGFVLKDSSGKIIEINSNTANSLIIEKNSYTLVFTGSKSGFLNNDQESEISIYKENKKVDSISYEGAKEGMSFSRLSNEIILTAPTPNQPNTLELEKEEPINEIIDSSYLKIIDVNENDGYLDITLEIHKANTNKEVIEIYAEENNKKISSTAKIKIPSKNINLTLTAPLTLKERINSSNIKVTVEGLDSTDSLEVNLKENKNLLNEKIEAIEYTKADSKDPAKEQDKEQTQIYKSKRLKSRDYALYLFIVSLIIVIIVLLYKNDKI